MKYGRVQGVGYRVDLCRLGDAVMGGLSGLSKRKYHFKSNYFLSFQPL